ncbi:UPSTREAM OF FLC protein [Actinidia rufa]|uniref:UPSTREAM OF FLC protein n=1 Tax=Actinidia rufa TaxID=165716 RepID=A0A7J0E6S9_9ERIC|nr:UPSTREAM OF FLC protein [Actinidia rufa]
MNSRASTEHLIPQKWRERRETSPERTKISTENKFRSEKKVSVVYYIHRNGLLEHPHFMEVPLSSSQGLYLTDVMSRLNFLRGEGMASLYSWSSKRSYKNGFVWHDLSESDLIHPMHGTEYILKGSELLRSSQSFRYSETTSSSENLLTKLSGDGCDLPAPISRRNQSWSSHEYRVYKTDSSRDLAGKSSDASTQTGDERRRRRIGGEESEECGETSMDLSREEGSSRTSSSCSEGVSGSRAVGQSAFICDRTDGDECPSGRMRASRVLKQLVTCGSVAVRNGESVKSNADGGLSMRGARRDGAA